MFYFTIFLAMEIYLIAISRLNQNKNSPIKDKLIVLTES